MKKILSLTFIVLLLALLCACGKVDNLIVKIDEFAEKEIIAQEDIDILFDEYNELSENDKLKVTNFSKLEKYEGVNIEGVYSLEEKIKNANKDANFSELLDILDEYESMNDNEKSFIDISSVQTLTELTDLEKATVSACQYVKKSLKSTNSFQLLSAKAIDDLEGTSNYYLVKLEYSATNSFGATIDDTSFQTINNEFENPWYALSLLSGDTSTALDCTSFQQFYLLHDEEPIEFDCDKIMYYIDEEIN